MVTQPRVGPPPKLVGENLREDVAKQLRNEIFSGQRRFGSKVDQDELAASLGVSRVPVREALIALEREGLVEWRARFGAFIAEISEDDIRDHYEITALLQALTTRRTILHASEADLDAVDNAFDALASSESEADAAARNDALLEVARRIGVSKRLVRELRQRTELFPMWLLVNTPERAEHSAYRHRLLMDAIRARDAERACAVITETFRSRGEELIVELRRNGIWD
jgi:DNA-binding GntR family transcriptional regulator